MPPFQPKRPGQVISDIAWRQPVQLFRRHVKSGILHPERLEDAFAEEIIQSLAGAACNQHAQHVGTGMVQPGIARLMGQRQSAEAFHPFVR